MQGSTPSCLSGASTCSHEPASPREQPLASTLSILHATVMLKATLHIFLTIFVFQHHPQVFVYVHTVFKIRGVIILVSRLVFTFMIILRTTTFRIRLVLTVVHILVLAFMIVLLTNIIIPATTVSYVIVRLLTTCTPTSTITPTSSLILKFFCNMVAHTKFFTTVPCMISWRHTNLNTISYTIVWFCMGMIIKVTLTCSSSVMIQG